MTTIHITPPPVAVEVTAEQAVAYLLRPGSGWTHEPDASPHWHTFTSGLLCVNVPRSAMVKGARRLTECLESIARAENRPALDVATDIAGDGTVTVGVGCEEAVALDRGPAAWRNRCALDMLPREPFTDEEIEG